MKTRPLALGLLALCSLSGLAAAQTVMYTQGFEGGPIGAEWSSNSRITNGWPIFTNFNGNYSTSSTTLSLPQPPGAGPNGLDTGSNGGGGGGGGGGENPPPGGYFRLYTLTFDFYCLDSWDGDSSLYGTDRFLVTINSVLKFDQTFANQPGLSQSFRAPDVGPAYLAFNPNAMDSIYRRISIDFTVPATDPTIRITWADGGLQGMNDESWGIDNINLAYQTVPAPGAAAGALAGLSFAGRRRRRLG